MEKSGRPQRRRFSRPEPVADLEEAAEKAHVDERSLEQARADLGVLVTRSNTGVQAVTWSSPVP